MPQPKSASLVGRFFHTFQEPPDPHAPEPRVRWQGVVLSRCEAGYEVGLFSWVNRGCPPGGSCRQIVRWHTTTSALYNNINPRSV